MQTGPLSKAHPLSASNQLLRLAGRARSPGRLVEQVPLRLSLHSLRRQELRTGITSVNQWTLRLSSPGQSEENVATYKPV